MSKKERGETIWTSLDRKATAIAEFTMRQYRTRLSTWVVLGVGFLAISVVLLFYIDAMNTEIEAVDNDGCYISDYARDNPYREDLAELMPLYIAVKYFPNRISSDLRDKILSCNYNRIKYLDSLNLNMNIYKD